MRFVALTLATAWGVYILLILTGCAHTPAVTTICLPMKTYTAEQQDALAAAMAGLPEGSPLVWAMGDYGQMRAADRACMAAK